MNDRVIREGGCLCGAIRYHVRGESNDISHCHCSICRRASGAAFVTWAAFPVQDFGVTKGKPAVYKSTAIAERTFCPQCGTQLTFQFVKERDKIDVTVCSLDDPGAIAPKEHIWTSTRIRWIKTDDGLPSYPERRPR